MTRDDGPLRQSAPALTGSPDPAAVRPRRPPRRTAQRLAAPVAGLLLVVPLVTLPWTAGAAAGQPAAAQPRALVAAPATAEDPREDPQPEPTQPLPPEPPVTEPPVEPTPSETSEPPETPPAPTPAQTTAAPVDPPPVDPPPVDPPPVDPSPAPVTPTATTPRPNPPAPTIAPGQPGPVEPGQPRRGIHVSTGDVHLDAAYWNAPATTVALAVTIANTGELTEVIGLRYTLPAGVSDAGTRGCVLAGERTYQCAAWRTAAGARFGTRLTLNVEPGAWRNMPLNGLVTITANAPDSRQPGAALTDEEGFAVLFPPGPPVPGVELSASDVRFDVTGQPTALDIRLGNTGRTDGTGVIEVTLPDGVSVPRPTDGCAPAAADRVRCDLGLIRAGGFGGVRLTVAATAAAQRHAPLSGAVRATFDARAGDPKSVQMSFRITAVAALATPPVGAVAPSGSQVIASTGLRAELAGLSSTQKTAIALIAVSCLLVVLALVMAITSLRRRSMVNADEAAAPAD